MPRGDQLLRQWNLLRLLQGRGEGVTLREMATEFDVAERTIQRDIEMLEEAGFPLEHQVDDANRRHWRLPHDFFRNGPIVLTPTEAVSLTLAERLFGALAGTHLVDGLESLLDKVRRSLPQQAVDYFGAIDDIIHVRRRGRVRYAAKREIIRLLVDAAAQARTVSLHYRAIWRGADYCTGFDPYGIVLYDDELFAVGRSHRAGDIRVFKIARIIEASVTDETFERPEGFSIESHFRSSFGMMRSGEDVVEIVVRFRGRGAALVEEKLWHESQRLELPDEDETLFEQLTEDESGPGGAAGAVLATYRLSNVVEFKRWIRSFGDLAEIVRPDWLRAEVADELRSAAALYDA